MSGGCIHGSDPYQSLRRPAGLPEVPEDAQALTEQCSGTDLIAFHERREAEVAQAARVKASIADLVVRPQGLAEGDTGTSTLAGAEMGQPQIQSRGGQD